MIHDNNNSIHWIAEEGKTFIRKSDNSDRGSEIWLGVSDSIENYEEIQTTNVED